MRRRLQESIWNWNLKSFSLSYSARSFYFALLFYSTYCCGIFAFCECWKKGRDQYNCEMNQSNFILMAILFGITSAQHRMVISNQNFISVFSTRDAIYLFPFRITLSLSYRSSYSWTSWEWLKFSAQFFSWKIFVYTAVKLIKNRWKIFIFYFFQLDMKKKNDDDYNDDDGDGMRSV